MQQQSNAVALSRAQVQGMSRALRTAAYHPHPAILGVQARIEGETLFLPEPMPDAIGSLGPLPAARIREVARATLEVLAWLHSRGVTHGSLSLHTISWPFRLSAPVVGMAAARLDLPWPGRSRAPEVLAGRWGRVGAGADLYDLATALLSIPLDGRRDPDLDAILGRMAAEDPVERPPLAADILAWLAGHEVPPAVPPWRELESPPRPDPRSPALVGREGLRDQLWDSLRTVWEAQSARVLVLQGAPGLGRWALASWLASTAERCGAARSLVARYDPHWTGADGLGRLFADQLGLVGLSAGEMEEQLQIWAQHFGGRDPEAGPTLLFELRGLARLVRPDLGLSSESDAGVRHALSRRMLERWAWWESASGEGFGRPVVLVVEDAQWGADAIAFARHIMEFKGRTPILVLLLVREDLLAQRTVEAALIEDLLDTAGARGARVSLPPMDVQELTRFNAEGLGLPPNLAARLAFRTRGHPLHAQQVVLGWSERGVLRALTQDPDSTDTTPHIPANLDAAWTLRLEGICAEEELQALEIAAVMGRTVRIREWAAASALARLSVDLSGLVDRLEAHGLLTLHVRGARFSFAHSTLTIALERSARQGNRLATWNRCAAEALAALPSRIGSAERRGRHLVAALDPEAALEPLLVGADERLMEGDPGEAEALLVLRELAMDTLRLHMDDVRRAEGWLRQAGVRRRGGQIEAARDLAERVDHVARWAKDPDLQGRAQRELALAARDSGDLGMALGALRQAERLLERGEPGLLAKVRLEAAAVLADLGAFEEAELRWTAVEIWANQGGDGRTLAEALRGRAQAFMHTGQPERARQILERARLLFVATGSAYGAAACHNSLGELCRSTGDLESAEVHYRAGADILRSSGSANAAVPDLNLGLVLVARQRYVDAETVLKRCMEHFESRGARSLVAACHVSLLPCLAGRGAWGELDLHLRQGASLLMETGYVEPDVGLSARAAGDVAAQAGESDRARDLYGLALRQFRVLGMQEPAAEVRSRLSRLR